MSDTMLKEFNEALEKMRKDCIKLAENLISTAWAESASADRNQHQEFKDHPKVQ